MERTFKIAIQGINIKWSKELIITVTLLELQDLQIKKIVFRYKSKTRQRKKKGHRQHFTEVEITKISG